MNILFVCSRNNWRSPTAETIYKNKQNINVKSAGTEPSARKKVSARTISWSDIIFVMERKHKQRLLDKFPTEMKDKKIVVLDIEDEYEYMNENLVEIITHGVEPYI